ncbi:MAG: thiamine pyrophosphate-dependent dehydrogenase E1 component subunit alpha [Legionellaceae bacterium]|nr:thiamine pyrophosphate-dependent dehydrogenase E1 component subunit alpha [Legionellaceae bacterium]
MNWKHKKLFYEILRIRLIEEAIAKRYPEGQMRCPTHLSIGQEAIPVAVCDYLKPSDQVVSSHRSHAHYLAKGGSLSALLAELYGKETGCTRGRGGSMNLSDLSAGFVASKAIIANTIPVGVGLAFAQQLKKSNDITCIFLGDAAIEEGAFYESLNFAVLKKLPVIFICENNLYSVNTHLNLRQPKNRQIFELARSIGAQSAQFDGNDVLSYYDAMGTIFADLRKNGGPWFLEFLTYRHKVHCGHEDDLDEKYRPKTELDYWLAKDPLVVYKKYILEQHIISEHEIEKDNTRIFDEIKKAFTFAEQSPFPPEQDRFLNQYAESNLDWLETILTAEKEGALN